MIKCRKFMKYSHFGVIHRTNIPIYPNKPSDKDVMGGLSDEEISEIHLWAFIKRLGVDYLHTLKGIFKNHQKFRYFYKHLKQIFYYC